jgi:hypothetical protein
MGLALSLIARIACIGRIEKEKPARAGHIPFSERAFRFMRGMAAKGPCHMDATAPVIAVDANCEFLFSSRLLQRGYWRGTFVCRASKGTSRQERSCETASIANLPRHSLNVHTMITSP